MGKLLRLSLITLAVLGMASWLHPPTCGKGSRRTAAAHLLAQLELAVDQYEKTWGIYPPGDGSGSRSLAQALQGGDPRGRPGEIFWGPRGDGQVSNPFDPEALWPRGVVHYRRYPPRSTPPFTLSCIDDEGLEIRCPERP